MGGAVAANNGQTLGQLDDDELRRLLEGAIRVTAHSDVLAVIEPTGASAGQRVSAFPLGVLAADLRPARSSMRRVVMLKNRTHILPSEEHARRRSFFLLATAV